MHQHLPVHFQDVDASLIQVIQHSRLCHACMHCIAYSLLKMLLCCAGVDQGRLNLARHGLFMCVRQVLNEQNVMYSMPSFKTGGGMAMPPGMRSGHASPNVNGQQDVHEPYVGAAPPSMGVQQAVGRASQAGWLPGQRGDSQVPGMAALVPDAIRQQF